VVKKHEVTFRLRNPGVCSPLQVAELNFKEPRPERLDNGPHLSSPKSFLSHVFSQRDNIQWFHVRVPAAERLTDSSVMPRPGVEPGLEVPETSVMSFSLPGRRQN
jgi:hypothetical protein